MFCDVDFWFVEYVECGVGVGVRYGEIFATGNVASVVVVV